MYVLSIYWKGKRDKLFIVYGFVFELQRPMCGRGGDMMEQVLIDYL